MKKALLAAAALMAVPMAANAQSMWSPGPSNPGIYIGGEGGLNWLLNNNNYNMDLGYAVGGPSGTAGVDGHDRPRVLRTGWACSCALIHS